MIHCSLQIYQRTTPPSHIISRQMESFVIDSIYINNATQNIECSPSSNKAICEVGTYWSVIQDLQPFSRYAAQMALENQQLWLLPTPQNYISEILHIHHQGVPVIFCLCYHKVWKYSSFLNQFQFLLITFFTLVRFFIPQDLVHVVIFAKRHHAKTSKYNWTKAGLSSLNKSV